MDKWSRKEANGDLILKWRQEVGMKSKCLTLHLPGLY